MGKYCCFGTCVSDERLGRPGYDISTRFYPFPKPCGEYKYEASEWTPEEEKTHILNCKKCGICRDWMFHCRRKDSKFQSLKNITRNTYICSKHFEGHFEALDHEVHRPMSYFPVNLSQRRKGKKRSRLSHDFEGEFSEENDVEQNRRATSLNANSNTNVGNPEKLDFQVHRPKSSLYQRRYKVLNIFCPMDHIYSFTRGKKFPKPIRRVCCVPLCSNNERMPRVSFHSFPVEASEKKKWIAELKMGKKVPKFGRVCSDHFGIEDFFFPTDSSVRRRLKKGAIPSQKLPLRPLDVQVSPRKKKMREERRLRRQTDDTITSLSIDIFEGSQDARRLFSSLPVQELFRSQVSPRSANTMADTFQFDEENDAVEDQEMEVEPCASDEDTEEASESEQRPEIPHIPQSIPDFKEQIFQEKLNSLKAQLQSLIDGTNSEYLRKVKKLELLYNERLRMNKIMREHELELTEKDYIAETRAASKEFDDKMVELKENLIQDMEEKRRTIEVERLSMELSGDSTETKPAMTRKLRRRPNDPAPVPEKRRGKIATLPSQVNLLLDEKDIESDLKALSRGIKANASIRKPANGLQALGPVIPDNLSSSDIRVEDGKLLYERKWFHRGQTVFIEGKDMPKFPAIISAIGSEAISVKKTGDSAKVRIYMNQLIRGKVSIKRRAS